MLRAVKFLMVPLALGAAGVWLSMSSACGADDNCAVEQENCSQAYLEDRGLDGCCDGLTCQDSPVTPGARVCR